MDPQPQPLAPGTVVADRYVIRGELGRGGFAVVYDAEHLGLGRRVAMKVVHLDDSMPDELLERSRREARNAALVRHPNILDVFDTGALADGSPFLVMERIEGDTLSKRVELRGLTIPAIVETGRQLLLALEALAAHSIIHRDVKSENVMLHDGGDGRLVVKLVDFGISKRIASDPNVSRTLDGCLVGTPSYMSPEQVRGEELDGRTDIYGAGAVLFEALTGRPPHDRAGIQEIMLATLNDPAPAIRPLRADCPEALERIVLKALAKAPDDRYPTAAAMRLELEQVATTHALPIASRAWRASQPITRVLEVPALAVRPRRARALAAAAVLVGVALSAGAVPQARSGEASSSPSRSEPAKPGAEAVAPPVHSLRSVRNFEPEPMLTSSVSTIEARPVATARGARRHHVRTPARPAPRTAPAAETKQLIRSAVAAYAAGQYDAADSLFRKVLAGDPGNPDALRWLGVSAAHRGRSAEARVFFERYLRRAPTANDAQAIRARLAALQVEASAHRARR